MMIILDHLKLKVKKFRNGCFVINIYFQLIRRWLDWNPVDSASWSQRRVWRFVRQVLGSRFQSLGSRFQVFLGLGSWFQVLGFHVLRFRYQVLGSQVQGSRYQDLGSRFKIGTRLGMGVYFTENHLPPPFENMKCFIGYMIQQIPFLILNVCPNKQEN